ncbi:MAG TPA: 2-hydroxyacyl-CoA dehydratase, partial [Mesotoga infera]|nr:2-hydroxyacyl-CoA dehydratase [Mesotoga infera]
MSKKSVGFGRFLRRYIDDEVKFRKWLNLGIAFESFRRRRLPSRKARFLRTINSLAVEEIYYSLTGRETAWVNLLAPSELLLPLGINPVSAEGVSGMLASMHLEGFAISSAA